MFEGRKEDAERLIVGQDADGNENEDAVYEYPLDVSIVRTVEILLSFGGPTERLIATLDSDGDVTAVKYTAHWGGDSIERTIYDNEALYALVEHYAGLWGSE
jgi:hypothetical protein